MQVPCPTGWKDFGNSCYLFVLHTLKFPPMSWEDSRSNCKAFGGELVSITNSSEVDFIYSQTKSMGNYKFWIGLYRNKTTKDPNVGWVWSDGSKFTNPEQWQSSEPNDYLNNEKCAELNANSKKWNDNNCRKQFSSICERGKEGTRLHSLIFMFLNVGKGFYCVKINYFEECFKSVNSLSIYLFL